MKAFKIFVQRITLVLGSLHLTIMAVLGIWLWSAPQTFGTSDQDSKCALDVAGLAILGAGVPFKSKALHSFSLALYSLFLVPGINLILPMALFVGVYCWCHYQFPPKLPASETQAPQALGSEGVPVSERLRRALPVCIGLGFLLLVNVIFITDIELTLHRNRHYQDQQSGDESEWGFGQILAMVLVFMPLRELMESIVRRRQELQTKLNEALAKAINDKDFGKISHWVAAGADPDSQGDRKLCTSHPVVNRSTDAQSDVQMVGRLSRWHLLPRNGTLFALSSKRVQIYTNILEVRDYQITACP